MFSRNLIPYHLIFLRLIIGFVMILLSYFKVANYAFISITLLSIGLVTDIFDGIIARILKVSNEKLRRLDSNVDQVFFISVVIATYIQCSSFFIENRIWLFILIGFEIATYLLSYLKFRKEIATHSLGAKVWTLLLFATLVQLMYSCSSTILFQFCFWVGILTRLEIIAIVLILRKWTNDVPSVFAAIKLRKGKEIKRNDLFNG